LLQVRANEHYSTDLVRMINGEFNRRYRSRIAIRDNQKYSIGVAPKRRNGKIVAYDGFLHYYDESGKRKTIHRERKGQADAREAIRIELDRLAVHGPKALEGTVTTFAELADYCEKEIHAEAEYNEAGEKLSGVRDVSTYKAHRTRTTSCGGVTFGFSEDSGQRKRVIADHLSCR